MDAFGRILAKATPAAAGNGAQPQANYNYSLPQQPPATPQVNQTQPGSLSPNNLPAGVQYYAPNQTYRFNYPGGGGSTVTSTIGKGTSITPAASQMWGVYNPNAPSGQQYYRFDMATGKQIPVTGHDLEPFQARFAPPPAANAGAYTPPEVNALTQIGQIDPNTLATTKNLGSSYLSELGQAESGQLPQGVMREIQQDVRGSQAANGNVNGVAQAAQEAMTTGSAGLNYLNSVRSQALGYLGSGQTPYTLGSNYVDRAQNQQTAAASGQMLPTYNPAVQQASPYSYINPNAGSDFTQGSLGYLNAGVGAKPGSPDTSGQLIGAGIGAAGTLASSTAIFASTAAGAAAFCQVARTVYGTDDPRYAKFRNWVLFKAPAWFRKLYTRNAGKVSGWLQGKPIVKGVFRFLMDKVIA